MAAIGSRAICVGLASIVSAFPARPASAEDPDRAIEDTVIAVPELQESSAEWKERERIFMLACRDGLAQACRISDNEKSHIAAPFLGMNAVEAGIAVPRLLDLLRDESYGKGSRRTLQRVTDRANIALQAISGEWKGPCPAPPYLAGFTREMSHQEEVEKFRESWKDWWARAEGSEPREMRRRAVRKRLDSLSGPDRELESALAGLDASSFSLDDSMKAEATRLLVPAVERPGLSSAGRLAGLRVLARCDASRGRDGLLRFARDSRHSVDLRLEALRAVFAQGDERWLAPALELADSRRYTLQERCRAIELLEFGGSDSVTFITAVARRHAAVAELLSEEDREIYSCAMAALSRITGEFVPPKPPFSRAARLRQVAVFEKWEPPAEK